MKTVALSWFISGWITAFAFVTAREAWDYGLLLGLWAIISTLSAVLQTYRMSMKGGSE